MITEVAQVSASINKFTNHLALGGPGFQLAEEI